MISAASLHPGVRILDVGPADASVALDFAAAGFERYLGLVEPPLLHQARATAGPLSDRFVTLQSPDMIWNCNADLLILRADFAKALWTMRDFNHLRYVAVEQPPGRSGWEARLAALVGRRGGRLTVLGTQRWGGQSFALFELPTPHERRTRTYFSPAWGPAGLAARLNDAGVRYALLRWFELLPRIEEGEDLDFLVADDDIEAFRAVLESEPGTQPVDLYSVSGLARSDYKGAAYYTPELATRILDAAVEHQSGFRVPAPMDHLHSLTYHAVYHKGPRAGIRSERYGPGESNPEHDYAVILRDLAQELDVSLPDTVEGIDGYLESVGWRPPADALRRLGASNPWAPGFVSTGDEADLRASLGDTELTVFLVRRAALDVVDVDEVVSTFAHFAFDVIHTELLGEKAQAEASLELRGGNWGRGPFPKSGGPPALVVVAVHYGAKPPSEWLRSRYPHLSNAEVFEAKVALRELVEARVEASERFNTVHSSDNTQEAWEYLTALFPEQAVELLERASKLAAAFPAPQGSRSVLSLGRRARVDLLDGPTGKVVQKTYAPPFERFLTRELAAMSELKGLVAAVPKPLQTGQYWFTLPYYNNALGNLANRTSRRLLPLSVVREMVSVLRQIYDLGYDVVDARPWNFLLDPERGLKIIDLEFLYRYDGDRPAFERSANFVGPWPGFKGDRPVGNTSYDWRWLPSTGLPLDILVGGSPLTQHVHRTGYRIRHLTVGPESLPRRILRRARAALRHLKWLTTGAFTRWARRRAATISSSSQETVKT